MNITYKNIVHEVTRLGGAGQEWSWARAGVVFDERNLLNSDKKNYRVYSCLVTIRKFYFIHSIKLRRHERSA